MLVTWYSLTLPPTLKLNVHYKRDFTLRVTNLAFLLSMFMVVETTLIVSLSPQTSVSLVNERSYLILNCILFQVIYCNR